MDIYLINILDISILYITDAYYKFYLFLQLESFLLKLWNVGNSLVVQWVGLSTFTLVAWVQSLVWELRS